MYMSTIGTYKSYVVRESYIGRESCIVRVISYCQFEVLMAYLVVEFVALHYGQS